MATPYSVLTIGHGVNIAYEVRGTRYLDQAVPIVLVGGMTAVRQDWERLSNSLSRSRPVLIYDHRGMGDSKASEDAVADISIETLARDLLALIVHLGWRHVAFCGWSMGGVVLQQLLTLPYHPTNPTTIPFYPTHVLLAATRSMVLAAQHGLQYKPAPGNATTRTPAERRMIAIKILEQTFDPEWLELNRARFEYLCKRGATGIRPPPVVAKQQEALRTFNFAGLLHLLPRDLKIMVIHGELDQVIPLKAAQAMMELLPSAEFVQAGQVRGQVPSHRFGHHWYEYFDIEVWRDVMEAFMSK
ncbi:hypothetical protein V5O48_004886 [Marasmius crinis-equi]|uniref:AB hydrolase-1 domain-containing protein n=1 Tax=Marasmius crinis-equi TaxID=585013 RepID=A0ABR3FNT4_9AGAR